MTMPLRRDMLVVAVALAIAAALYVLAFRDLMAASPPL